MTQSSPHLTESYTPPGRPLSGKNSIFAKVLSVLAAVADSRIGIGEVLHDYAVQTGNQLKTITQAQEKLKEGTASEEDRIILAQAGDVIQRLGTLLTILPDAMRRNNADVIGVKSRISLHQVEKLADEFPHSPEARYFLELG